MRVSWEQGGRKVKIEVKWSKVGNFEVVESEWEGMSLK